MFAADETEEDRLLSRILGTGLTLADSLKEAVGPGSEFSDELGGLMESISQKRDELADKVADAEEILGEIKDDAKEKLGELPDLISEKKGSLSDYLAGKIQEYASGQE
jgi:hypothetical protein